MDFVAEFEKLNDLIVGIKTELATKATEHKLDILCAALDAKDKKIELLESKVAVMENTINLLKENCESNEQYSRRCSLRILNIPVAQGQETVDDCMVKVNAVIQESGADIPEGFVDRCHRVGKILEDENGVKKQAMIVKFTTWSHRTRLYRSRKNLRNTKVFLDLTQTRFKLLKMCQNKVKDNPLVNFVFVDVNCTLCVKLTNGRYEHFSNEKQFNAILNKLL